MGKAAILIGVEQYADARISPVKYARSDAQEFSAVLGQHGFETRDQVVLTDASATKAAIESRVRRVLARLTRDDTFYLYYSGHGFAKNARNYITCYDTILDDLKDTSVAVEWLLTQFKKSKCKKLVMFLDACESGMLATSTLRGIYTDLTEDELRAFFDKTEHCVCFASCKPGEYSYPADKLKHGIWTYHLIEAFSAKAPKALEKGYLVTAASLQNYLKLEVPRTVRSALTGTHVQTPWVYGAASGDFLLADVSSIVAKRKAASAPGARQLRRVRLYDERALPVRTLSGFLKGHHVPERVNDAATAFVSRISEDDVVQDRDQIHAALRAAFKFRRKDLETRRVPGGSSIITPYFDYDVGVSLNPEDPSRVLWVRQVLNIREPERVLTAEFEEVFDGKFDTLEFSTPRAIDVGAVVDQIEELDDERIRVDFDSSLTWCKVELEGIDADIRITSDTVSVVGSLYDSPRELIESFFECQNRLIDRHQLKMLPFIETVKK